jgi:hypothetical protein
MLLPTACFFLFFLLEQKETKIQGERPTSIFRAQCCQGNGVKKWRFALFRQSQPHHCQSMSEVLEEQLFFLFLFFLNKRNNPSAGGLLNKSEKVSAIRGIHSRALKAPVNTPVHWI